MVIVDYNEMSVEELEAINKCLGIEFEINDGRIIK